ncbi:MAG: hypothetical protein ACE5G1_12570, partial [bacterium]
MYFRFPILLLLIIAGLTALIVFKGKLDDAALQAGGEPVQSSMIASSKAKAKDKVPMSQSALQSITSRELRAHVDFLADDLLEGRETASRGIKLAALYLAKQFERFGVKGAGPNDSFFQPVELYQKQVSAA